VYDRLQVTLARDGSSVSATELGMPPAGRTVYFPVPDTFGPVSCGSLPPSTWREAPVRVSLLSQPPSSPSSCGPLRKPTSAAATDRWSFGRERSRVSRRWP
jgi:hypothetical protein